jgi:hypothetical protein
MRKPHETTADRLWQEKLDSCASLQEGVVLLLLAVVAVGLLFITA